MRRLRRQKCEENAYRLGLLAFTLGLAHPAAPEEHGRTSDVDKLAVGSATEEINRNRRVSHLTPGIKLDMHSVGLGQV